MDQRFSSFFEKIFANANWKDLEESAMAAETENILPYLIEWEKRTKKTSTPGAFTLNPDVQLLDFKTIPSQKIKILELEKFILRPRWEVAKYVAETYGKNYYLPGVEYWKFAVENPKLVPASLRSDGMWYFLPGSLFCDIVGTWCLVSLGHNEQRTYVGNTFSLKYTWHKYSRVVLIEK